MSRPAREDLPPINFRALADALLQQADTLVPLWLPGGHRAGPEWVCGSLAGGEGTSCSVSLVNGKWGDFATGEKGGDLIGLYAAIHGLDRDIGKAAAQVARELGLETVAGLVKVGGVAAPAPAPNPRPAPPPKAQQADREVWHALTPVPAHAPAPTFRHFSRQPEDLMHTAAYMVDGALHGYVLRYRTSDGGKDTLPYTYCQSERDGGQKWINKQWDEPRPLFFPAGQLPAGRTVILVEGEVKAEVLQGVLDAAAPGVYCVASWPGGCKAWAKASWSWLAGSTVIGWPDCDAQRERLTAKERASVKGDDAARQALEATKPLLPAQRQPGMAAQLGILTLLRDTHCCTVSLLPIPEPGEVVSGWDCKDAIETDGWTPEQVLAFLGRAQPLPVVEAAAPEKKSRDPVGTQGAGDAGFDGPAPDDDGDDWVPCGSRKVPRWLSYYWDPEKERWNISRKAVITCLERDPALRGVVAFNELTNTVQCRRAWPWPHAKAGEVRGVDGLLLGKYLSETYGLPSVSKASLEEAVQTVAHAERYHPIREWLLSLQWDGQSRIDKWLVYALGESPQSLSPQQYEYLSLVGRYWLLGMVWRVMEPGCKFDYCVVLEGIGGLRKSTLVEVLAGREYFSDTPFDMSRGKEAQEQVQGVWGYEIAELSALSKADVNAIKAFISSKVDRYRVAYGTTVESFPRQCVLTGTTNEDTYLRDRTGNRRFWPAPVRHVINTEWVQRQRGQLFAEAFALYLQGVAYTPSADQEIRLFAPMQDSRLIETAVESELLRILTRPPGMPGDPGNVNVDAAFVTIAKLVQALGADVAKATPGLENQIRGWLKQMGWERDKVQLNGVRAWGYKRPAQWPPTGPDAGGADESPAPAGPVPPAPSTPGGPAPAAAQVAQWEGDIDPDDLPF